MIIIPAIDIKDGRCVRLRQGRMDDETIFAEDPLEMADKWVEAGAERLHLVDLDGATAGTPRSFSIIEKICSKYPDLPIQVGGGIRDEDTVQDYLNAGVQYAIIGTRAVTAPHFVNDLCMEFPGHIIIGLDAKNGKVAIDGWSKLSHHDLIDLAQHFEADGVAAIVFTDVSRDGMMQGVNVEATAAMGRASSIPVIASGGITNIDDIRALASEASSGICGAITGRAIYEGTLDVAEAQSLADQLAGADG